MKYFYIKFENLLFVGLLNIQTMSRDAAFQDFLKRGKMRSLIKGLREVIRPARRGTYSFHFS